ncbi:lipoyl(octanoyl) transferase LipB [Aquisalimonas lutea]|uniref:lipoyl(octanoyl) transferase LipB n=1 Tax=Aquisalimonas lutea TaxID=1327750 RepID=UPI0025B34E1C|nr:lipoyl(octanoyl) transferase LipB [Aquisalimonas lutea]MDN3516040.1 lipoyl(octanoyl) transferase LipB [Aquisalimonas lutea]
MAIRVRELGRVPYEPTWRAMQAFTEERTPVTPDELWSLEHPPVFTQGLNGRPEHLLDPGDVPVVPVDRGGQVTYHGPGQAVVYVLVDLRRRSLGIRRLVTLLETAVVELLAEHGIDGRPRPDAPGVYVDGAKIASVGLRVRRGASYHGVALNVDMDLSPFTRINPCGYQGLAVTRMRDLGAAIDAPAAGRALVQRLCSGLRPFPGAGADDQDKVTAATDNDTRP